MIWLPVMFCDEPDMLRVRMDHVLNWQFMADTSEVRHVVVEAPVTHKGIPKPLHYAESGHDFSDIEHVIASLPDDPNPWVREHAQRDAAWSVIDRQGVDDDWVLIGDLDEIPSYYLLDRMADGELSDPTAVRMRVFIHAVDWEVPQDILPPQCVAATVGYIRRHGGSLAAVRDARADYETLSARFGGMHFSWIGTPEQQAYKLHNKSCHTELLGTREARLIATGEKYRDGTPTTEGLPMKPVTVDDQWPLLIREHKVPAEWYRP